MKYHKSQTGWLVCMIFAAIIFFLFLTYKNQWGNNPILYPIFIIFVILFFLILLVFYKLGIKVDDIGIHIIYGIGLIHIKIQPERVDKVSIVRNPWYYGLGIRITPEGMLYNIQGLDAVELLYYNGKKNKRIRIGSDDCANLKKAIENRYQVYYHR